MITKITETGFTIAGLMPSFHLVYNRRMHPNDNFMSIVERSSGLERARWFISHADPIVQFILEQNELNKVLAAQLKCPPEKVAEVLGDHLLSILTERSRQAVAQLEAEK